MCIRDRGCLVRVRVVELQGSISDHQRASDAPPFRALVPHTRSAWGRTHELPAASRATSAPR
eukprot:3180918-Pyramimonas_sp.AAC.1